jgi:hypothetical protein
MRLKTPFTEERETPPFREGRVPAGLRGGVRTPSRPLWTRTFRSGFLFLFLLIVLFRLACLVNAQAAEIAPVTKARSAMVKSNVADEEALIPTNPSMPTDLKQKEITPIPHCERYFIYDGKKSECDSNVKKDAVYLRPIMRGVPNAIAELDAYQSNKNQIGWTAYLGSLGLVTAIVGVLIDRPGFDKVTGSPKPGGILLISGAVLAIHSFIYAFGLIKANEAHLDNAVRYYNDAHPEKPIRLEFEEGLHF